MASSPPRRHLSTPPNKGLQELSRALGAGTYSLVGWAGFEALVKIGLSQLKPSGRLTQAT